MNDEDDEGWFEFVGWKVYPPGEEPPQEHQLDERMQQNVRRAGDKASVVFLLGTIALAGGAALRAVGVLAELPWRVLAGPAAGVTPVLAIPVSAALWTLAGVAVAAAVRALRHRRPARNPVTHQPEEA